MLGGHALPPRPPSPRRLTVVNSSQFNHNGFNYERKLNTAKCRSFWLEFVKGLWVTFVCDFSLVFGWNESLIGDLNNVFIFFRLFLIGNHICKSC